ncbi:MAG: hypothetical protein DRQ62_01925, partial [Gammaproteobacteria bacterium]
MDALLRKINSFGLSDPVLPRRGEFYSDELQSLYRDLVAKGKQSYIDSLEVGATVEDIDICDFMMAIETTNNLALKTSYEKLLEGSKNHLRTFIDLLQQQGRTYHPQRISQELFEAIKKNENFNCHYEKKGLLMLCQTDKILEEEIKNVQIAKNEGLKARELSMDELKKL